MNNPHTVKLEQGTIPRYVKERSTKESAYVQSESLLSIAISLKRIADMIEGPQKDNPQNMNNLEYQNHLLEDIASTLRWNNK